jgi:hypothetical protein
MPSSPFHVQATYVVFLYRVARARGILRSSPRQGLRRDRVRRVMQACGLPSDQSRWVIHFDDRTDQPVRGFTDTEIGRLLTAHASGHIEPRVRNLLSTPC